MVEERTWAIALAGIYCGRKPAQPSYYSALRCGNGRHQQRANPYYLPSSLPVAGKLAGWNCQAFWHCVFNWTSDGAILLLSGRMEVKRELLEGQLSAYEQASFLPLQRLAHGSARVGISSILMTVPENVHGWASGQRPTCLCVGSSPCLATCTVSLKYCCSRSRLSPILARLSSSPSVLHRRSFGLLLMLRGLAEHCSCSPMIVWALIFGPRPIFWSGYGL